MGLNLRHVDPSDSLRHSSPSGRITDNLAQNGLIIDSNNSTENRLLFRTDNLAGARSVLEMDELGWLLLLLDRIKLTAECSLTLADDSTNPVCAGTPRSS